MHRIENKLVVIRGGREGGMQGQAEFIKRVIIGLYEIMCVKLLKTVKHYRIEKTFNKKLKIIKTDTNAITEKLNR